VDQSRRLERLARLLVRESGPRQTPQLVIDQRQELAGGGGVAGIDLRQNACHVGHRIAS
jgi:hypothetical protein